MINRFATLAASALFAVLGGCTSLSDLSAASTSRTVGYWQGAQSCVIENTTVQQAVGMKLEKDLVPLVSNGILYIERTMPQWSTPARVWIQVSAESSLGGKAIITSRRILKQEGPVYWATTNWEGTFIDNDSLKINICGSDLVLKRQVASTGIGGL